MVTIKNQKVFFLFLIFIFNLVCNNYLFASYILGVDEFKEEKKIIKKFEDTLISHGVFSLNKEADTLIWKEGCPIYPIVIKNALGE